MNQPHLALGTVVSLLLVAVAAACGSSGGATTATDDGGSIVTEGGTSEGGSGSDGAAPKDAGASSVDANLPVGTPIVAPKDVWTWVEFPDAVCDDGSPTGIGVYLSGTSDKLLVFMQGGGACWDYSTCAVLNTSTHGPFGAAQFNGASAGGFAGSVLENGGATNPFKGWNMVYVPYCTGDVHAGDAVTTYTVDAGSATMHHKGHANVMAYLARLSPTFAKASQVAVTGSSAGGGALFNYDSFRSYWPTTSMMLVDDSLPPFQGSGIPDNLRTVWRKSWNLDPLLGSICGATCKDDFSKIIPSLTTKYPNDRMSLLSYTQDATISGFFGVSGPAFQASLASLTTEVIGPTASFKSFVVTGTAHTMLFSPATTFAGPVQLSSWLGQQVSGDPKWTSVGP